MALPSRLPTEDCRHPPPSSGPPAPRTEGASQGPTSRTVWGIWRDGHGDERRHLLTGTHPRRELPRGGSHAVPRTDSPGQGGQPRRPWREAGTRGLGQWRAHPQRPWTPERDTRSRVSRWAPLRAAATGLRAEATRCGRQQDPKGTRGSRRGNALLAAVWRGGGSGHPLGSPPHAPVHEAPEELHPRRLREGGPQGQSPEGGPGGRGPASGKPSPQLLARSRQPTCPQRLHSTWPALSPLAWPQDLWVELCSSQQAFRSLPVPASDPGAPAPFWKTQPRGGTP